LFRLGEREGGERSAFEGVIVVVVMPPSAVGRVLEHERFTLAESTSKPIWGWIISLFVAILGSCSH